MAQLQLWRCEGPWLFQLSLWRNHPQIGEQTRRAALYSERTRRKAPEAFDGLGPCLEKGHIPGGHRHFPFWRFGKEALAAALSPLFAFRLPMATDFGFRISFLNFQEALRTISNEFSSVLVVG